MQSINSRFVHSVCSYFETLRFAFEYDPQAGHTEYIIMRLTLGARTAYRKIIGFHYQCRTFHYIVSEHIITNALGGHYGIVLDLQHV